MAMSGGLDVMQPMPGMHADQGAMTEQPNISLSAQSELELELSLRGSLLVQQQRRIVQLEDELQRAWAEIERLRSKLGSLEREKQPEGDDARAPRYWTPEEHARFVEAVQQFGWKDVKAISQHVGTRNPTQVRTHAQKLILRQQKEQAGVMQQSSTARELPPLPPDMPGLNMNGAPSASGDAPDKVKDDIDAAVGGGSIDAASLPPMASGVGVSSAENNNIMGMLSGYDEGLGSGTQALPQEA